VSCFGHGCGEAAVSFIDWNAVRGMMGMLFPVEAENLSQFAFREFHLFFARAAYDWKCETYVYVHQA